MRSDDTPTFRKADPSLALTHDDIIIASREYRARRSKIAPYRRDDHTSEASYRTAHPLRSAKLRDLSVAIQIFAGTEAYSVQRLPKELIQ